MSVCNQTDGGGKTEAYFEVRYDKERFQKRRHFGPRASQEGLVCPPAWQLCNVYVI